MSFFIKNTARSHAIFFLAVVAHFLSSDEEKDVVISNAMFRTVASLYSSNPLLLFIAILESSKCTPLQKVLRHIIRGQSFTTLLYQSIDILIENQSSLKYISRVTSIFKLSVEESIIITDSHNSDVQIC